MTDHVSLTSLARKHRSDKVGPHSYTSHYEKYFAPFQPLPINLLEIGIGGYENTKAGGESLRMWKEYFPAAQIFGLDYYDKSGVAEDRIRVYQGSQGDPRIIASIIADAGPAKFDIIIDDGSHRSEHAIATFFMLFQYVNEYGLYQVAMTLTHRPGAGAN